MKSRGSGIDSHEFVGVWKWQRVQEHAVDYGEQGAVRANAECESENRDRGKSRVLPQHPKPIAHVLSEAGHNSPPRNGRMPRGNGSREGVSYTYLFGVYIDDHSCLSATIGSTFIARCAGM